MSASRQRFLTSSGMCIQRQRLGNRRPRLPQAPRHVFVGIAAARRRANAAPRPLRTRVKSFRWRFSTSAISMISLSSTSRMTIGISRKPDLNGCLVAPLAGDDLKTVAALPDNDRLDDPFFRDRRHQLGEVAHDLARLIRDWGRPGRWGSSGRSGCPRNSPSAST